MLRPAFQFVLMLMLAPAITAAGAAQAARPETGVPPMGAAAATDPAPQPEPAMITALASPAMPGTMSSETRAASVGKTIHVTIGHSIFIDTKTRLRRVYVSERRC